MALSELRGRLKALRNVKRVELVEIPVLVTCVFSSAFKCVEDVKMENASLLEEIEELKEVVERKKREEEERRRKEAEEAARRREEEERRKREEERRRREEEERKRRAAEEERLRKEREEAERRRKEAEEAARRKAVISCKRDWDCVDKRVGMIEVSDGRCNEEGLKELDLRGFVNLRELKVGNECFKNVKEVKVIGLSELESVEIGMNSFTQHKNGCGNDPNRHFYLKDCPKLKSLKMGRYSFSDYSVIEIENVDALEAIEMGELNEVSFNFHYASLELKSVLIHSE